MQKKKNIVILLIAVILIFISFTVIKYNSDSSYTYEKDGIRYAVSLDGVAQSRFPSKGLYRVDVTCENATCKWLYDDWKLAVENITGDVSCDIDFVTITKNNLNDYIIGLTGITQGAGKVVNEIADIPDYSTASVISETSYTNQSIFSSTSSSSTSGTEVSGVYLFADSKWTSDATAMTSGKYYHFKFTPSESGYYQMCYELSSGSTNNELYAFVGSKKIYLGSTWSYISASSSASKTSCVKLGYVSNSSYIKITQRAYTTIATLSFSINKVSAVDNVNAGTRYEGKNPNNYIWFNNELWRIIGVFDENSHGQSNTNLVKIMRVDSIGGLAWDKSNVNDWTTASLNSLLNGAYLNAQDGTSSGYCFAYSTTVTTNCDYRIKGIQDGYRSMIQNVTWYLGGCSSERATAEEFYGYERGTNVYSGRPTSTTGYIGLIYPSDYGYSVLSSSCAKTTYLYSYDSSNCGGQSWIEGNGWEWTLSPHSAYSNSVFLLYLEAKPTLTGAYYGFAVRPVLYLKSDVYYIDGDGSEADPIIIAD